LSCSSMSPVPCNRIQFLLALRCSCRPSLTVSSCTPASGRLLRVGPGVLVFRRRVHAKTKWQGMRLATV
jgi:hypothetical protein